MAAVQEMSEQARGVATILGIGTANPETEVLQKDFPELLSRGGDDKTMLKLLSKFKHICERTTIRKRHIFLTEEMVLKHPDMLDYNASSLDTRQDILPIEVPKLAKEAALKAIQDWGQPKTMITHVIFTTISGVAMPGYDYKLVNLLELGSHVQRVMLFQQGCYGGGAVLRLAKDIAENNLGSRVMVVCAELNSLASFRGPTDKDIDYMVGQALFSDGASCAIVGANPDAGAGERALFEIVSATQSFVPDTEKAIGGQLRQAGLTFYLTRENPTLIANNIEKPLTKALSHLGVDDWNSIFWVVHPGGPTILDQLEAKLGLDKDKLRSSRHVLTEFGNMSSPTVLFVLDETRKRSLKEGKGTTGEGYEYGVLLGIGPGITFETLVLRSFPNNYPN